MDRILKRCCGNGYYLHPGIGEVVPTNGNGRGSIDGTSSNERATLLISSKFHACIKYVCMYTVTVIFITVKNIFKKYFLLFSRKISNKFGKSYRNVTRIKAK